MHWSSPSNEMAHVIEAATNGARGPACASRGVAARTRRRRRYGRGDTCRQHWKRAAEGRARRLLAAHAVRTRVSINWLCTRLSIRQRLGIAQNGQTGPSPQGSGASLSRTRHFLRPRRAETQPVVRVPGRSLGPYPSKTRRRIPNTHCRNRLIFAHKKRLQIRGHSGHQK